MNMLEFLKRVLPEEGYYCAGAIVPGAGFKQKLLPSIQDLADFSQLLSERGGDSYYGLASFKDASSRKHSNVQAIKVFALDLDVGKETNSYAKPADALVAVGEFIKAKRLPKPMIVSSGAGFHVYWTLTKPLTPEVWKPLAEALKATAIEHGLVIDPTVTADIARVLRPVGTTHTKTGNTVKLLIDAPSVTPEEFASKLSLVQVLNAQPRKTTLLDNLKVKRDLPPAVAGIVVNKCNQLNWAVRNQDKVPEPMWYSIMGVAAYTDNPEEAAIAWSQEHPAYSQKATLEKLEQWKANASGPATCAQFENVNPGGCKGCAYLGKINTPVRLGAQFEEVSVAATAPETVALEVPIPPPFKRTAHGIKYTLDDTDIDVCPFDIYPVGYGRDETLGYETVRFRWNRPHVGWTLLTLRQAYLTDGHREFASACADQGIVLGSKKLTDIFQHMLRSYMEELRKLRTLTNIYASMGWKDDFSNFVVGDTIIRKNEAGEVVKERATLAAASSRVGADMYGTAGTLQAWSEGTRILEVANMPWHMFALGVGFSAPLYVIGGLKGMTVSLYGPTGGGKTLIQYWIQSIYGDPDKLHFAAKYTQNSLFSRLALYSNMPMTIGEATMMPDKEVGDFLYWVTQGRDKARLNRSAEERDPKTWATPVILSTNKSIQAKLLASGLDTDAQMARLLEVNIPEHNLFGKDSSAGRKIYSHLMKNYGHAGHVYIAELIRLGEDGIRALVDKTREEFPKKYGVRFHGSERFWEQAIVLQDVASEIAKGLGLIQYDYTIGTRWIISQMASLRNQVSDNKIDAFDMLSEYLNDAADSAITVTHTAETKPYVDLNRLPRGDIRVRFDVYRPSASVPFNRGTLSIDRAHFRKWIATRGGDYKGFNDSMIKTGALVNTKTQKAYLGRDTPTKLGQSYVLIFDLKHPRLEGILNDAELTYSEAKVRLIQPGGS